MTPIIINAEGNGFMLEAVTDWSFYGEEDELYLRVYLLGEVDGGGNMKDVEGSYIPYVRMMLGIDKAQSDVKEWIQERANGV